MTIVPTSSGNPVRANSKNPNWPIPASAAASDTITLTGLPVSASSAPAWAANASGISSCDVFWPTLTAMTTITGTRAATDAFGVMRAVKMPDTIIMYTTMRVRPVPARSISCCPTHVVTPVASRASLTTNSAAMNNTVGSPKPAVAWSRSRTPVAHSDIAVPTAMIATGTRLVTKSTTTTPSTMNVVVLSAIVARSSTLGQHHGPCHVSPIVQWRG